MGIKFSELKSSQLKSDIAQAHGATYIGLTPAEQAELDAMTPKQLLQLWAQWHLGSQEWAGEFLYVWEQLNSEVSV